MVSLLPGNSDLFETALETSLAPRWSELGIAADAIRGVKLISPPSSYLPYLVYEYGLGELTPYVPDLNTLVVQREGVDWQRVRGTASAVAKGLSWIGITASLEDAWHGRAYWNSTQLRFNALPTQDFPDLERIEGITRLSLPLRSHLRRGVIQYDATAIEADGGRLDECLLDQESGISVTQAGTLWSFGRLTEVEHLLTEEEGVAIGNWIEPVFGEGGLWINMDFLWADADFLWAEDSAADRQIDMAAWFVPKIIYATFRTGDGTVIGHRLCRANHQVRPSIGGALTMSGQTYRPGNQGTFVYLEALTDFDNAWGVTAASVELTIGATRADGVKPGKLWLAPNELQGGLPIAETSIYLPLRKTVREQVKFILRF